MKGRFTMARKNREYLVYAKRLQNNPANETSLVGVYPAFNKNEAESMALCDYSNNNIYDPHTYFAVRKTSQAF